MTTMVHDTADVRSRVSPEEWQTRVDLAACYRLVALNEWTDLIYNHISARVPGSDHYLLNPFGFLFEEITASSLVKVDLDGDIVDPSPYPIHKAGFVIHSAVHAARPEVGCVMHTHTRAGMALSILEEGLLPLTQHAMLFYGRVGYHGTEGFALDVDERTRLANDLGDNAVLILRNHGTLVAGKTINEAYSMMWHLEKAMQAQLDALATGRPITVPSDRVAQNVRKNGFTDEYVPLYPNGISPLGKFEWPALLRKLDRIDPSYRT